MKIEAVDFFYLSMPIVRDIGDGSQDALLVRVEGGGFCGWGECEASPLVSMASWNSPMSHSACKPLSASVLGQCLDEPEDIRRINALVRANSFDLLQTDHTLSGIDVALWDLLGRKLNEPVYRLLGYEGAYPKTAYASQLFGDDPHSILLKAQQVARAGFRAAKFGWGPYGRGTVAQDADQVQAAREGLGNDRMLLVDAGTVWGDDVSEAEKRLPALQACNAAWLEEPFVCGALSAYKSLASRSSLKLAGGEGCHNFLQAKNMIDFAGLGYIQIDAGRVGGITTAKAVADYAALSKTQYVNHTFTTPLALSASLQPYAGLEEHSLCEYPTQPSALARSFTKTGIMPDVDGLVRIPEGIGLGIEPDIEALREYCVPVEIKVAERTVFRGGTIGAFGGKTEKRRV
ncbi:MAG TPA: mandelate racemase/muconate lactonizing enzyme family protein [Verrucomicrobiae bacterium]|nr:mandelate racemase/muconate lactonizing enzyme family protein [Verrucomicrobiae bacterium]